MLSGFTCQEKKIGSLTDPVETGYLVKNNPLQGYGYVTFFCVSASLRKHSIFPWLSQTVVKTQNCIIHWGGTNACVATWLEL